MASRIEDYGLIGDMKGSALVSRYADIDWLCVPRFDSDASMAALLGRDEHGRWAIRPTTRMRKHEQRYRGDTLILETDIECDGGKFRVIDFMPPGTERSDVVRIVEGLEGELLVEMILEARFGYGSCSGQLGAERPDFFCQLLVFLFQLVQPVEDLPRLADLHSHSPDSRSLLSQTIMLKLNGGLGTSMGL